MLPAMGQVAAPAEPWGVLVWNPRLGELVVPAHQGKERTGAVGIPRVAGVVGLGQWAAGVGVARVAPRDW